MFSSSVWGQAAERWWYDVERIVRDGQTTAAVAKIKVHVHSLKIMLQYVTPASYNNSGYVVR
jgi:hypothetical protein